MSRVITFSRTFPAYHPRAGEPTYFVEKVLRSVLPEMQNIRQYEYNMEILKTIGGYDITMLGIKAIDLFDPKHHTIRAGHRWKVGDWFSPRVWSGKPYNSKQVTIAPDIQIKKIWRFEIKDKEIRIWGSERSLCGLYDVPANEVPFIAQTDGLSFTDFMHWFVDSPDFRKKKAFNGQVICWNENIKY